MHDIQIFEQHTFHIARDGEDGPTLQVEARVFWEDAMAAEPISYHLRSKAGHIILRGSRYTASEHDHMWMLARQLIAEVYADDRLEELLWHHDEFAECRAIIRREHEAEIYEFRRAAL